VPFAMRRANHCRIDLLEVGRFIHPSCGDHRSASLWEMQKTSQIATAVLSPIRACEFSTITCITTEHRCHAIGLGCWGEIFAEVWRLTGLLCGLFDSEAMDARRRRWQEVCFVGMTGATARSWCWSRTRALISVRGAGCCAVLEVRPARSACHWQENHW
jgi:hypothetical protein